MDLSLHAPRFPVTFEKWYIDALLDDGAVLLVYLGVLTIAHMRLARLTANLFPACGPEVHGSAVVHRIAGGKDVLRFGSATLVRDRLRFTTAGLSGDLVYRPRRPPCSLREPFLTAGGRTLHWSVEIPDADVTGTLRWPDGSRAVVGRGYRDRVWYDLLPWRFPIRQLTWGRAAAGDHAATWVHAATAQGIVAAAWLDGRMVTPDGAGGPPSDIALGSARVFLDTDVAALEGLHLGVLGGLFRRLGGDLHETKWQAPCTIAGTHGMAVLEVVRWRE